MLSQDIFVCNVKTNTNLSKAMSFCNRIFVVFILQHLLFQCMGAELFEIEQISCSPTFRSDTCGACIAFVGAERERGIDSLFVNWLSHFAPAYEVMLQVLYIVDLDFTIILKSCWQPSGRNICQNVAYPRILFCNQGACYTQFM